MVNLTLRPLADHPITLWLERWAAGDAAAADALAAAMTPVLRRVADRLLRRAPRSEDFGPTQLLNEVWLRLLPSVQRRFANRRQFFGSAVRAMHFVLIDRYRRDEARAVPLPATRVEAPDPADPADTRRLDVLRVLEHLCAIHERQGHALLLVKVLGYTLDEVAAEQDTSVATARRDLRFAQAFIRRFLQGDEQAVIED